MTLELSSLPKTWIFDLDGTIVKHNGYIESREELLPGVKKLIDDIPFEDYIIILSARSSIYKKSTTDFLKKNGIRYDTIIFDIPVGERILVNDNKPSGLKTAIAVQLERNSGLNFNFNINKDL